MLYKIVNSLVEVDLSKELIPLTSHNRNSHAKSFRIPYEKRTYLATALSLNGLNGFKSGICELKH